VNEEGFKKYNVKSFENLLVSFTEYKS
jgi:hypothetical protein